MFSKLAWPIFITVLTMAVFTGCQSPPSPETPADPKVAHLKLPAGFHADHLFGPSAHGEGSWVAMTFDDKGRLIASDQYGALYRMTLPAIGDTAAKVQTEELMIPPVRKPDTAKRKISVGYAHGLLYAFHSLYVIVNHQSDSNFSKGSGLYRLQDTDGDDQYDKITLLRELDGEGEHGPHSIILAPDGKSLFVVAGNFTKIPQMSAFRNRPDGSYDNLLPLVKDPNGHDNTVHHEGGWIAQVDSSGTHWELIASGFRNPFDIAFNEAGDLFTFDSDMEWDIGTPWYRPIRVCHVTSGGEFGWRPGTEKWSPAWPDNLPPILNVGQGSPTNVVYGAPAHFPETYRRSLFTFDWSFGIIYAIHLEPQGASYKATGEEFVSGSPLPLTDGVIGPDGALYFLTGGRRLESDLYRVYYGDGKGNDQPLPAIALTPENQLRRRLESFHGDPNPAAIELVWPNLKHADRFVRYAARIALEHQPVATWRERALAEKDPVILTQAAIALARKGEAGVRDKLLLVLTSANMASLNVSQQIDWLRAVELVLVRLGKPSGTVRHALIAALDKRYPAKDDNEMNRELSKILVFADAPDAVSKTVPMLLTARDDSSQQTFTNSSDLIMRNPEYGLRIASTLARTPPLQQTYYALVLSQAENGWTPGLRETYFQWFYRAFGFRGGHSFIGFIDSARKKALAQVPADRFAYFNALSGDSIVQFSGTDLTANVYRPKGPGRDWVVADALKVADSGLAHPNFDEGKGLFVACLCSSCHQVRGEGGVAGPDLTQLGTRFSYHDMLESIIEPSKTISDQFGATVFSLKNGSSVVGRLISQDGNGYVISQNPFAPGQTRVLAKADVLSTRLSDVSPMLPGLIDKLNPDELRNLLAFLKSGGNPQDTLYTNRKK